MKKLITSLALFSSLMAVLPAQTTDITVQDKTLVQRCLIDGPSTRMIAVGNPGGYNYTFDALHCTPVYVWAGGFIDFKGESNGRGGNKCKILGVKQSLGTEKVVFRRGGMDAVPAAIKFHGYRRDQQTGAPTFNFEVDGLAIEQRIEFISPDTVTLNLTFPKPSESKSYYLIDSGKLAKVELGAGLSWQGTKAIEIPAATKSASITLHLKPATKKFVRKIVKLSGEQIYKMHCNACHSLDGSKMIGPSFKAFWGKKQMIIRDGKEQQALVDTKYVKESITAPQAAVVKGYEAVPMPSFSKVLSEKEIDRLVKYLSQL